MASVLKYLFSSLALFIAVQGDPQDGYDFDIVPQPKPPCKGCVAYAPFADLLESKLCRVKVDPLTTIPGRLMLWSRTCGIVEGDSGKTVQLNDISVEVLMVNENGLKTTWKKSYGGLPCNAIKVGKENGVTLYAGRTKVPGTLSQDEEYEGYYIGKVRENNPGLLEFYNSKDRSQQSTTDFQFLVCPKSKC